MYNILLYILYIIILFLRATFACDFRVGLLRASFAYNKFRHRIQNNAEWGRTLHAEQKPAYNKHCTVYSNIEAYCIVEFGLRSYVLSARDACR